MYELIIIPLISLFSGLFAEFISWLFIYRTPEYKRLTKEKEKEKKKPKVNKKKVDNKNPFDDKSIMIKLKQMFIMMIIFGSVYATLYQLYDGLIVAKLPFTPFSFITFLSHRNLSGTDYTDCSFMFLYVINGYYIRTSIQKYLKISQVLATSPFAALTDTNTK